MVDFHVFLVTSATDMSKWKDLFVPDPVLRALSDVGFDAPTPIQCLTLPAAIRDRMDILGAAETVSNRNKSAVKRKQTHNNLKNNSRT